MMGQRKQTNGKSWKLHKRHYKRLRKSKFGVVLIENVPEYEVELVKSELTEDGQHWKFDSCKLDPRIFGVGCARHGCKLITAGKAECFLLA